MQRDFSLASLCQALFPELLGAHLHICRSQELKSLWGSLLAPYGSWKTVASMLKQGPDPQKNTMAVRVAKSIRDSDGNWARLHSPAQPTLQIMGQRARVSLRACHKQPSTSACTLPVHSSQQCLCSQPQWQGTAFISNRMKPKRRKPNLKKMHPFWAAIVWICCKGCDGCCKATREPDC